MSRHASAGWHPVSLHKLVMQSKTTGSQLKAFWGRLFDLGRHRKSELEYFKLHRAESIRERSLLTSQDFPLTTCLIYTRRTLRPRLEAAMGPEIFFGCFTNLLFNEGIHAARRYRHVCAGIVFPGWIKTHFPPTIIGQEPSNNGNHPSMRRCSNPR